MLWLNGDKKLSFNNDGSPLEYDYLFGTLCPVVTSMLLWDFFFTKQKTEHERNLFMTANEYSAICNHILSSTMAYVDTSSMKRYKIDKNIVSSNNPIYVSAVTNAAPITLAFAPAGTGKSALVKDRVHALEAIGVPSNKIMVLNMNIAKTKQMQYELPNVNVMTFSDFTHEIFNANYPCCEVSDISHVINLLRLQNNDAITNDFINKLSITNQQDRMSLLTLFVNTNLQYVIDTLCKIRTSDYSLESMICQNQLYHMKNNPYDIESIIINGVQNMPIPILCSVLEYANMYHCNLFITGSPEETIYEFNMAYSNAMNVLSAYSQKHIDIVRLKQPHKMSNDIRNTLNMTPDAQISSDNVCFASIAMAHEKPMNTILEFVMGPNSQCQYLNKKISNKEPVLIVARSKTDINDIKQIITNSYLPLYPELKILDLTTIQCQSISYGSLAAKHYNQLVTKYPNCISTINFFNEINNILCQEIESADSPYMKSRYELDKKNLPNFAQESLKQFIDFNREWSIESMISYVIDKEAKIITDHAQKIKDNTIIDISGADIVLSTIHTAIDIRCDNVIAFMKNTNDKIDNALYRVALSRANKSEYIVFANHGNFAVPYQKYLTAHAV